jgi:hypothetical protein
MIQTDETLKKKANWGAIFRRMGVGFAQKAKAGSFAIRPLVPG